MWALTKTLGVALAAVLAAGCAAPPALDTQTRLRAAAQSGDKDAQYQLGQSLCCGIGGGYDTQEALHWLCRSALQGHPGAQYALGRHYGWRNDTAYRPSVPQDRIYAYMWYSLAALQGIEVAAADRDALAQDMSPGDLAAAADRVRDWRKLGCRP